MMMMSSLPVSLEQTYALRALPKGSARYWSHFFAAPAAKQPLLGLYALLAEWQALIDPATEHSVALLKLNWWQEEIKRLASGRGAHPISVYLASLPGAAAVNFATLQLSLAAAIEALSGVPLERAADLPTHAEQLWGQSLLVTAEFSGDAAEASASIAALSQAELLSQAIASYRQAAQFGRVAFPVDELLAAGIENADLLAKLAPPKLASYLAQLKGRAEACYAQAGNIVSGAVRVRQRHLLVLAALGQRNLERTSRDKPTAFRDMLCAWRAARRAQS